MSDELITWEVLTDKLIKRGHLINLWFTSFKRLFYGRHHDFSITFDLQNLSLGKTTVQERNFTMPISVAFSANHSVRSIFFVGAIAKCKCPCQ